MKKVYPVGDKEYTLRAWSDMNPDAYGCYTRRTGCEGCIFERTLSPSGRCNYHLLCDRFKADYGVEGVVTIERNVK
ncbi:MAG: hypothetical protein LUC22_07355 [Prevotella sp.]|nr:hypothetical protein [Prevotella sp.]